MFNAASAINQMSGTCSCGLRVEAREGFWVFAKKQIQCKACHDKSSKLFDNFKTQAIAHLQSRAAIVPTNANPTAQAQPASHTSKVLTEINNRPRITILYDNINKCVVGSTVHDITRGEFMTVKHLCEISGFRHAGGNLFKGPLSHTANLTDSLLSGGVKYTLDPSIAVVIGEAEATRLLRRAEAEVRVASTSSKGTKLKEHQRKGVLFLAERVVALLGDDMGLGKTAQSLIAAGPNPRLLVVAPAAMRGAMIDGEPTGGWADEVYIWRPDLTVTILEGENSFRWPEVNEVVVLSYHTLPGYLGEDDYNMIRVSKAKAKGKEPKIRNRVKATPPPLGVTLIADEAQILKNSKNILSKRFAYVSKLVRENRGRVWGVTATPLENKADDLWNVLDAIGLATLTYGSRDKFEDLYDQEDQYIGGGKKTTKLANPSPEVAKKLQKHMLRRNKRDVLDLPPISFKRVVVEVGKEALGACAAAVKELEKIGVSMDVAMDVVDETSGKVKGKNKGIDFTVIATALEALGKAKAPYALEHAKEMEESSTPAIFFATHVAIVEALGKRKGWCSFTGSRCTINIDGTPKTVEMPEAIKRFQSADGVHWVAATIQCAGVGITLTRASEVVMIEKLWNPARNYQAIARADRMGQRNAIIVTDYVANHPLDKRMSKILEEKNDLFLRTIGAAAVVNEDREIDSIRSEVAAISKKA